MIYFVLICSLLIQFFGPWWLLLPMGAWVGYHSKNLWQALWTTFFGVAIVWIAVAYYFDMRSQGLASQRIAGIFELSHPMLSFLITGFTAAFPTTLCSLIAFVNRKKVKNFFARQNKLSLR